MNKEQVSRSVQKFQHSLLGSMRVAKDEAGKEWFCLGDVSKCLGIENSKQLKTRLKELGVCIIYPYYAEGSKTNPKRVQATTYIDEANLYRCIFQSRKPEAEAFQDWVFEEVLPSIRRGGLPSPEPAPIAGVRPIYYCDSWYYNYSELCHAIGYTEDGGKGYQRIRGLGNIKGYKQEIRETRGNANRIKLATPKLANLIVELRKYEVAREEALFRFACESNPASKQLAEVQPTTKK